MAIFKCSAGLLYRGDVRRYLEMAKFSGLEIEWVEIKGWLDSYFTVRGEPEDVAFVAKAIKSWMDRLNKEADNRQNL